MVDIQLFIPLPNASLYSHKTLQPGLSPPSHDSTLWSTSTSTTSSHLTQTNQCWARTASAGHEEQRRSKRTKVNCIYYICNTEQINMLHKHGNFHFRKSTMKSQEAKGYGSPTQSNIRCHRIIPAIIDCQEQQCPFRHPGWENSIPPSRHLWRSYLTFSIQQGTFVALMKSVMSHWREASHLSLTPTALPNLHFNQQWENIQQGQKLEGNMSPGDSAVGWAWKSWHPISITKSEW